MAKSGGFTHGGSVWKNLALLFRALANILAFGALWYGLVRMADEPMLGTICAAAGGVLCVLLLAANLILPFIHRVK